MDQDIETAIATITLTLFIIVGCLCVLYKSHCSQTISEEEYEEIV